MTKLPEYKHRGVRALVLLHERHLRRFYDSWQMANSAGIKLPGTDDPSYVSMAALLRHVLRAARGYMTWICEKLELPDPDIRPTPEVEEIEIQAKNYLEHLLERWRYPLKDIEREDDLNKVFDARWKVPMAVESMLEHAVMHPIRHSFQLMELLEAQGN